MNLKSNIISVNVVLIYCIAGTGLCKHVPVANSFTPTGSEVGSLSKSSNTSLELKEDFVLNDGIRYVSQLQNLVGIYNSKNDLADMEEPLEILIANVTERTAELQSSLKNEQVLLRMLLNLQVQMDGIKELINTFNSIVNPKNSEENLRSNVFFPPEQSENVTTGSRTRKHSSWVTLYNSETGEIQNLDFWNCPVWDECCMNLDNMNDNTDGLNTHGTCVSMYLANDCIGESVSYYPGSTANQNRLNEFKYMFSSAKPCHYSS